MIRPAGFLLLLIVGLAALVGPAQARSQRVVSRPVASAHDCSTHGMPIAVRSITARDCARGRTVVRAWFKRLKTPGGNACLWRDGSTRPGVCTVQGWHCISNHTVNGQTYPVTCTADRGRRRVHFVNEV